MELDLNDIELAAQVAAKHLFDEDTPEGTESLLFLAQVCSTLITRSRLDNNSSTSIKSSSMSIHNKTISKSDYSAFSLHVPVLAKKSNVSPSKDFLDTQSVQCQTCFQHFYNSDQLLEHSLEHCTNSPDIACPVCGKGFTKNAHLSSHLRIHTGERPFKCNLCPKQFTQKSTLNRHKRVHTGEKPFPCRVCGKRFAQQSTLASHVRTHSGNRPFGCMKCGKRFNKSGHLHRHLDLFHGKL